MSASQKPQGFKRSPQITDDDDFINAARNLKAPIPIKKEGNKEPVNMKWEPELTARVDRAARRKGLTRSAYVRMLCLEALEREGVD